MKLNNQSYSSQVNDIAQKNSIHFSKVAVFTLLFIFSILALFPELSFAGTGGEQLKTVYEQILELAQGYGGKTLAAVAFILSAIGAVRGNLLAFGSALGVGIAVGVGPEMFSAGVSAII